MQWLGHVTRMEDGHIPKDLLYGELATGKDQQNDPIYASRTYASETFRHWHKLRLLGSYCHRDAWGHTVKVWLSQYEEIQRVKAEEKRLLKRTACRANRPTTPFTCSKCGRDCHSRIGLHSHNRRCKMCANLWSFETDRCQ